MSPVAAAGVPIAVWVDSFSDCFEGHHVEPLLRVLADAGYAPEIIRGNACCGLTWISTGQRDGAQHQIRSAVKVMHPIAARGIPIVGLEPSCLATWRSDAFELAGDDSRVTEVAQHMRTLAEVLLDAPHWNAPDLSDAHVIAQPHCHHASVLGWRADAEVLARTKGDRAHPGRMLRSRPQFWG